MKTIAELMIALKAATTAEEKATILADIVVLQSEAAAEADKALASLTEKFLAASADKPVPPVAASANQPVPPVAPAAQMSPELEAALGRIKKLEDDKLKLEGDQAKSEKEKMVAKFAEQFRPSFGDLTAKLLAKDLVETGALTFDATGVEQLTAKGITYKGKEVLEYIRTENKDHIVGRPGADTRPSPSMKQKPEDLSKMSGYQLLTAHVENTVANN